MPAFIPRLACLGLLWLAAAAAPPATDWMAEQSAQCTAAIAAAETKYALPAGLLGTIAKVESGRPVAGLRDVRAWPWTIDADGLGLFLDSRAAAIAWAKQGLARGVRSLDLGCMQVNWQIHNPGLHSIEEAFDPAANADYAARYLRTLHEQSGGDWNVAVGWYHSHTADLAADYRNRVANVGAGILTGIGGPEPLYQRAIRQGTLRLALAGGGMLMINVRRQPAARPQRPLSRCKIAAVLEPLLSRKVRGCAA